MYVHKKETGTKLLVAAFFKEIITLNCKSKFACVD